MYTEFLIIYIMLGVLILLAIIGIVLLIAVLKKAGSGTNRSRYQAQPPMYQQMNPGTAAGGVAFCKNCGSQFNASLRVCPRCGSPR